MCLFQYKEIYEAEMLLTDMNLFPSFMLDEDKNVGGSLALGSSN